MISLHGTGRMMWGTACHRFFTIFIFRAGPNLKKIEWSIFPNEILSKLKFSLGKTESQINVLMGKSDQDILFQVRSKWILEPTQDAALNSFVLPFFPLPLYSSSEVTSVNHEFPWWVEQTLLILSVRQNDPAAVRYCGQWYTISWLENLIYPIPSSMYKLRVC